MINIKPVVHYMPTKADMIAIGQHALIHPLDHPSPDVSNTGYARTSLVIAINKDGFETQNTVYKRAKISEEGCTIF